MIKQLTWGALFLLMTLVGCQQAQTVSIVRDDKGVVTAPQWKKYDVQPQVIYRIDDHRFVTLESYNHCSGETWYNDTRTGVRTMVGHTWPNGFLGKLIIDDPSGMNVVIPKVSTNSCGDRGCMDYAAYSTDGGKTFAWMRYDESSVSFDPVESSKRYIFVVKSDRLYVLLKKGSTDAFAIFYPLIPGVNLSKPYPTGVRGGHSGFPNDLASFPILTLPPDKITTPATHRSSLPTRTNQVPWVS